jgi:hypothetical protein
MSALRPRYDQVSRLCDKMCGIIDVYKDTDKVMELDLLFGQVTYQNGSDVCVYIDRSSGCMHDQQAYAIFSSSFSQHSFARYPIHASRKFTVDTICSVAFDLDLNALGDSDAFQGSYLAIKDLFETSWLARIPLASYMMKLPTPFEVVAKRKRATKEIQQFAESLLSHIERVDAADG